MILKIFSDFYDASGHKIESVTNGKDQACEQSVTKLYNSVGVSRSTCTGELIFEDNFENLNQLLKKKWTLVEEFSTAPVNII